MTSAKPNHLTARRLLLDHLDLHPGRTVDVDLDPLEAGIVGDTAHAAGGDSYHLGRDKIRARGGYARYSVDESPRDARGLDDYASAMDIGYFKVTTKLGTFDLRDFSTWLVGLCRAGDPDTADLREVIYSPDGKTVRRWDDRGIRSDGDDSHLSHTHLSEYRDATGVRMVRLATRWLQLIGLIPTEDDMPTKAEFLSWLKDAEVRKAFAIAVLSTDGVVAAPGGNKNADGTPNTHWSAGSYLNQTYAVATNTRAAATAANAGVTKLSGRDFTDESAIAREVLAGIDPALIAAAIPTDVARQVADELATRLAA